MKGVLIVGIAVALLLSACMAPADDDTTVIDTDADTRSNARDTTTADTTVNVYDDNQADVVYVYDNEGKETVVNHYSDTTVVRRYFIAAPSVRFEEGEQMTNEEIARDFVEDTNNYQDDGANLTMAGAQKLATNPPLLVYTFTYDRQNTEYTVQVVIMNGRVVSAITDDTWNEITQQPVGTGLEGDPCDTANTCEEGLYCFRVSDEADAAGYCLREQ